VAHCYACKFGLNRLRIDGDIRQEAAITAIMENVVIAILYIGLGRYNNFSFKNFYGERQHHFCPKFSNYAHFLTVWFGSNGQRDLRDYALRKRKK